MRRSVRTPWTADGWDVFTGWRRLLCYLQRAGATARIKRVHRRRARRALNAELRQRAAELWEQDDGNG